MKVDIESMRRRMLFLGLNDAQLQAIASILRRRVLKAGEVLVRRGELDDALYIVERGSVELQRPPKQTKQTKQTKQGGAGKEQGTVVFETGSYVDEGFAGDFFGEFSLLDLTPWGATVVSRERTVLFELNRDELYELFSRDVDLQIGIVLNIARALSRRLRYRNREAALAASGSRGQLG